MTDSKAYRLTGRRIILGISGGIAAYKTAELVRLFKKAGAEVQVVMTAEAARFVTPLTLGTLSEREVLSGIFPENETGSWTRHIGLGLWADLFVIAPATAQTLSKLANGVCDSMLTAVSLAARCPRLVCPSMDHDMYEHPATQANMDQLRSFGYEVMEAEFGSLASGLVGPGRLPEPQAIFERSAGIIADSVATRKGLLAGRRMLVSAGPTRELIDPVRFISNRSTGTMGYEIAAAAARRGADVVLVSGPTALDCPEDVRRVDVVSTADMREAVQAEKDADIIVMVAAVADYTAAQTSKSKIKKDGTGLTINLKPTTDILAELGAGKRPDQILVGFALETDDGLSNAMAKLEAKNLDWIVLNNPNEEGAGFGPGTNRVTILGRDGSEQALPVMEKREVAEAILNVVTPQKQGE